jgi:hypothetical protein
MSFTRFTKTRRGIGALVCWLLYGLQITALTVAFVFTINRIQRCCGEIVLELKVILRRPLISASFAETVLDCDRAKVNSLVDTGELLWCFNLSTTQNETRELRILSRCLVEYMTGKSSPIAPGPLEFQRVLAEIFPSPGKPVTTGTLSHAWSVSRDHLEHLRKLGLLHLERGTKYRTGPGGSAQFDWSSVASFMFQRRVT